MRTTWRPPRPVACAPLTCTGRSEYDDTADKPLPAPDAFDIVASDFLDLAERLGS